MVAVVYMPIPNVCQSRCLDMRGLEDQLQSIVLVAGNWKRREVRPASGWRGKVFWRGSVVQTSPSVYNWGHPLGHNGRIRGRELLNHTGNFKRFKNYTLRKKRAPRWIYILGVPAVTPNVTHDRIFPGTILVFYGISVT
jgi:hypothetical protein